MNLNPMLAGLALVLACVSTLQTVQQFNTREELDALRQSLQSLQRSQDDTGTSDFATTWPNDVESTQTADSNDASLRQLTQRIEQLELRPAAVVGEDAETVQKKTQDAVAIANTLVANGYVDEQQWQTVANAVEAMDKEANKAFWEKTFAAIESGALVVYGAE